MIDQMQLSESDFDPAAHSQMQMKHTAILGTKTQTVAKGLPYLSIVDKNTGAVIYDDLVIFDNTNFTLDEKNGIVYFIHGKTVRWYSFE